MPVGLKEAFVRGRYDFPFFCEYFLDLYLHDGQKEWGVRSVKKQNVLTPGNRYGKSVVLAAKHIWYNFYKIGDGWERFHFPNGQWTTQEWQNAEYSTINVSISADQSAIVYREAVTLTGRPKIAPFVKDRLSTPFPHIVFMNGAIMHARSTSDAGKYIDGHHYAYMSYDEAGWEPQLDWLMGTVLLPRLTDFGGPLDIVGTPKGRGYLYQVMMKGLNGDPNVYAQKGSSYDNPYIPRAEIEALEAQLNAINPKLARQSVYGDFVEADGLVFTYDQVQGNLLDTSIALDVRPIAFGIEYLATEFPSHPSRKYSIAWDLARKNDRTVGTVLDITVAPFKVVCFVVLSGAPWETQYEYIRKYGNLYRALPTIDVTGLGDVVDEELTKRGIDHVNFTFNDGSGIVKQQLITNLQNALDSGRPQEGDTYNADVEWGLLRCGLIEPLLSELSMYEWDDKKLDTDCVMSLAMAVWQAYRSSVLPQPVKVSMRGRRGRSRRVATH